jgi:rhodanese-related sulfurtransferase
MDSSQLIEFIGNHGFLSAAMLLVTILLLGNEITIKMRGFAAMIPAAAVQLINQKQAQVLDVRDAATFNKGHVANAHNAPLEQLLKTPSNLKLQQDKPVLVVCENGHSANRAAVQLKQAGYSELYTLKGGVMAWRDDKLPLTRK